MAGGKWQPPMLAQAAYTEFLFRACTIPIEILCRYADLGLVMLEHNLASPDWMLLRAAIVVLDVVAVVLLVWLTSLLTRRRRSVVGAIGGLFRRRSSPSRPHVRPTGRFAAEFIWPAPVDRSSRSVPSRATASHGTLR
jgi:hypothetical protein